MAEQRLLTAADAARILGVVPATVRVMALTGRLNPTAITEGGTRLFRRDDVEKLAEQRARDRRIRHTRRVVEREVAS
jgi:excisionase family DNA binding protein